MSRQWFVPGFDEALHCQQRIATVELVWGGAGYKIQVVPSTMGDVPIANKIAAVPQLLEALREIVKSGVYPDCPACEIMYEIADNVIAVATGDDKDNE